MLSHLVITKRQGIATLDIKVPAIGDFAEVTVIELMVKPGDTITLDQRLMTVTLPALTTSCSRPKRWANAPCLKALK